MIEIIFPKKQNLIGSLIAATPYMLKTSLDRAVILITGKNRFGGYNGIQINNPFLKKNENLFNIRLLVGGVINKGSINLIHTPDMSWGKTKKISDVFYLTSFDKKVRSTFGINTPYRMLAAFGIFQWHAQELENEIISGIWFHIPYDKGFLHETIYETSLINRWHTVLQYAKFDVGAICIDNGQA